MAKIVRCSVPAPQLNYTGRESLTTYNEACAKYEADVTAAYRKPGDPLAGKIFRSPFADGYASYAVVSSKPLVLAHLEEGDAYRLASYAERGLRLADINARFAWTRALAQAKG